MTSNVYNKFIWSGVILASILLIGTVVYWFIGEGNYSFLDTLYMTVITITTIGFGEVIELSGNPAGRIFTIFIAISGIGALLYVVTNLTALVVEGELTDSFRRRRMEKQAHNSKDHYIVCGLGSVGGNIIGELHATKRSYVLVDISEDNLAKALESFPKGVFVIGDATNSDTLLKAGIKQASGLFAVTDDDNQNLVISLSAKQLNPTLRVVARCNDVRNSEKIKKAGADTVVSPGYISGLRMASEMIRPTVVSFLDTMLRDKQRNLRIEEVSVPDSFVGSPISAINLDNLSDTMLLALKNKGDWIYNPSDDCILEINSVLIVMTTPEERKELGNIFH
jgi:voltage-gated potassium channel